jgi:hypothetical protein
MNETKKRYVFVTLPAYGHISQIQIFVAFLAHQENIEIEVWTTQKFASYFDFEKVKISLYAVPESTFVFDKNPLAMAIALDQLGDEIIKDLSFKDILNADVIIYDVHARWTRHSQFGEHKARLYSYAPSFRHSWRTWLPASLNPDAFSYWRDIVLSAIRHVQKVGFILAFADFKKITPLYAPRHIALIPKELQPGKILKEDYYQVLYDEKNPIIYHSGLDKKISSIFISLGTVYAEVDLMKKIITDTQEIFSNARIIVSYQYDNYKELFSSFNNPLVEIYPFVDQKDVLRKVDLFVTHCGTNGVIEALFGLTPMLCLPQAVDQFAHAASIERNSFGVYPGFKDYESKKYKKALIKIQDNFDIYQKNISLCRDSLSSGSLEDLYTFLSKE